MSAAMVTTGQVRLAQHLMSAAKRFELLRLLLLSHLFYFAALTLNFLLLLL